MYCTPIVKVAAARKAHRCTWCGQDIEAGQPYERWASYDDAAFQNKMHPECAEACGDKYYLPFDNDRPVAA